MAGLAIIVTLLVCAYRLGGARERVHLRELAGRESRLIRLVSVRSDNGPHKESGQFLFVTSSVVLANDYFKYYLEKLRNNFGGTMSGYEILLDRTRREALCRLRESALALGAHEIVDVHVHTSNLRGEGVEVSIYATAIKA